MSEISKCPVCGQEPIIYPTHDKADPWPEATECCGAAFQTVRAWNQYATLLARHNALVEAVAWLREVDDTREWLMEFPWLRKWSGLDQCMSEARAEVDRLLNNGGE